MNLLALESSTKHFSLAVAQDAKILSTKNVFLKKVLSDSIVPDINRVLTKARIKLDQLDGFVVGLGPGSFTSLRVGLATIKGLAFALDKPVVGICSLEAIALNIFKAKGRLKEDWDRVCVISDARRNLVYSCSYEFKKDKIQTIGHPRLGPIAEVLNLKGSYIFAGDALPLFQETILAESGKKDFPLKVSFAPEKFWFPQAKELVTLALPKFQMGKSDNIDTLVPIYLYPEDCQVAKK